MKKNDLLTQQTQKIQKQLDKWVRKSGILLPGEVLRVTLTIVPVPVVILEPQKSIGIKETRYYHYISATISEEDWETLLKSPLPRKYLRIIEERRVCGNVPGYEGGRRWIALQPFNAQLRSLGLKFRLERVDYDSEKGRALQLFKVEPKEDVIKFWPKHASGRKK